MFLNKQYIVCVIPFLLTICSSNSLTNNSEKSDVSSVSSKSFTTISSLSYESSYETSSPSLDSTLKTQSPNDLLRDEDSIELTTFSIIENNETKSFNSEHNSNYDSKVESDVNGSQQELTSPVSLLSTTSLSDPRLSADPKLSEDSNLLIKSFVSQINSTKIYNQTFESGEKRRTNANPSVDDIISGLLQLIGGNVKLSRPSLSKLPAFGPFRPDPNHSGTRINNRGPPKAPFPNSGGPPMMNVVPPNVLIGPGRPTGIALPALPSHLARLPVPLNIVPTKSPFVIPESDVSFLLGLIKPHIKDEKDFISLKNLPKFQTSQINDRNKDKSSIDSVNTRPLFTEKILANPSKIQEFIKSNAYYSNIFSSLSSHLSEVNATKTALLPNVPTVESQTPLSSKIMANISETIVSSFVIPTQTESPVPTGPVTDWVPVLAPTSVTKGLTELSEEPLIITMPDEPSVFEMIVKQQMGPKATTTSSIHIDPTPVVISSVSTSTVSKTEETTIKVVEKSSSYMESVNTSTNTIKNESKEEADIVYGRPAPTPQTNSEHKSIEPSFTTNSEEIITLLGSAELSTTNQIKSTANRNNIIPIGKPIVVPVEMDEVKPHVGPNVRPNSNRDKGKGSVNAAPTLQVGSGVFVSGDDSNDKKGILQPNPQTAQTKPLIVRRPPFRPRPNVPIVRIDTCIVGDDSTCESALNEKCLTELGLSSCQCRPGFSRNQARSPCVPIISLAFSLKVDRIGDKKLSFTRNLLNSDSEDYQYLEYESLQAINSIFSASKLSRVFLGTKINKFYSMAGKTIVNASINLELNNATNSPSIKRYVQQELTRVIAVRNNNIGESQLWVDGSLNAIPRVEDLNECSNVELNDCSKHAKCINDFGSFHCECQSGYEDKFPNDKLKSGRFCLTCSPQYCSNRGECFVVNGERECKCKGNFIGSKCDIDAEVLGVALGGSVAALIIIIITFLCLYMWNQRWKKEQQKMEAMSAASGHTFSYVNKQAATGYRLTIDDRMRWAQIAEAMASNPNYSSNYYVSPEQMSSSQHHLNHVYATPNRVSSSGTLLNDDLCAYESRQYSRSLRPKSRGNSGTHGYSVKNSGNESIYNETEFSTREMIYSPTHLIPAPRSQFSYS